MRIRENIMKRQIAVIAALLLSLVFLSAATAMQNNDYAQVPTYVVQNIPPNILILLDNSGSMFNYAYIDGNNYDFATSNNCSSPSSPCTGFVSTQTYYGYFDPNTWYQYAETGSTYRFIPDSSNPSNPTIGATITNPNSSKDWNGNFLNWLTMRRTDIVRKALTGGLCDGGVKCGTNGGTDISGYDRLVGVGLDYASVRGGWKQVSSPYSFIPAISGSPSVMFQAIGSNNEPATSYGQFQVYKSSSCNSSGCSGSAQYSNETFNVKVQVPVGVEGVLQSQVGARARIGLATYGSPWNEPPYGTGNGDGAKMVVNISATGLANTVSNINNTVPSSNTPLAEALLEAAGYFGQTDSFTQFSSGPGPNYTGGGFTISSSADPYNYGTKAAPIYPACSNNYILLITDGEPCEDGEVPSAIMSYAATGNNGKPRTPFLCSNSGSLSSGTLEGACPAVCSDGSTPAGGTTCPSNTVLYPAETSFQTCPAGNSAAGLESVALWLHDGNPSGIGGKADDIRQMQPNKPGGINSITLYTVFAFGSGSTLLKYAAINGGFNDANGDYMPDGGANSNDISEWSTSGTGQPDNYLEAAQAQDLESAIGSALTTMLKRASSGTAASVLASSQGSGASLVQAVFYPAREFGDDVINWTGALHEFWYYVDPYFIYSDILENTNQDYYLTLTQDDIAQFYFDQTRGRTMADRFLSNPNGSAGAEDTSGAGSPVYFEDLLNLWEAGQQLWSESPSSRTIYTDIFMNTPPSGCSALSNNMISFSTANSSCLQPYMNTAGITNGTNSVIQWTQGNDLTGYDPDGSGVDNYRSRTVSIIVNGVTATNVWKLGDILNSTPRVASWMPLDSYNTTYNDASYTAYINTNSQSGFTPNPNYMNRGTVYAGGNDGMLHAFTMGKLSLISNGSTPDVKAQLLCKDGTAPPCLGAHGPGLGVERWAFIPENALPYLQYMAGVDSSINSYGEAYGAGPSYSHVYTVDLTPYLLDASVGGCGNGSDYWDCPKLSNGSTWRTILIGGMRLGGASSSSASCCSMENTNTTFCAPPFSSSPTNCCNPCVTTPAKDSSGNPVGYSTYFALDVTDETNPKLLWEFASPNLGFSTSGPAIVRISATTNGNPDLTKNGRWFVVFGSGPTGPINTSYNQFMGESDQDLQYFVFDLENGPGANNANVTTIDTKVADAFSGDLFNSTSDPNGDYQDEALYGGYVRYDTGNGTWDQGGIGRLLTINTSTGRESVDSGGNPSPANWSYQQIEDGVGPVSAGVTQLQYNYNGTNQLWLYFGTGRDYYSYYTTSPIVDTLSNQNYLVGMIDPCYQNPSTLYNLSCITTNKTGSTTLPLSGTSSLSQVSLSSGSGAVISSGQYGWYIDLDAAGNYTYSQYVGDPALNDTVNVTSAFGSERVITDPETSTNGAVYFATFKPYDQACAIGGKSFLWAVNYNNGAALTGPATQGTALLQVSTGSIQQINLGTSLTQEGGRRTSAFEGMPPTASGVALFTSPQPVKQMLYIREDEK